MVMVTDLGQVLPDDSYVLDYMALRSGQFHTVKNNYTQVVPVAMVLQDTDFSKPDIMDDCCYANYLPTDQQCHIGGL